MTSEPMFAEQEDDEPSRGPSSRWYVVAAVLLLVGLTLSLLIGRSAAGQIDPQPEVSSAGVVELPDSRVSVFVAKQAYDEGAQCTVATDNGPPQELDYGVEPGERTIDGQTYVRVAQTPSGLESGSYRIDCGDIDAADIALTSSSGLGGAAGLLLVSVVLGVGLTILALLVGIVVAVLRFRAGRTAD